MKSFLFVFSIVFVNGLTLSLAADENSTETVSTSSVDSLTNLTTTTPSSTTQTSISTTTVQPPSTTEAPADKPEVGNWNITTNGTTCLLADFAAQLDINYNATDGNGTKIDKATLFLSKDATVLSQCPPSKSDPIELKLSHDDYTLTLRFVAKDQAHYVDRVTFEYKLDKNVFPNATDAGAKRVLTKNDAKIFKVPEEQSYACKSSDKEQFDDGSTIEFTQVKVDSFLAVEEKDAKFRVEIDCDADTEVSDTVPIAVGCALAALVVIVLIAYFIGRRRSRRSTYESV